MSPGRNEMTDADARDAEIAELARQIQQYLETHPNAADSLGGIMGWWLARQRYEESEQKVKRAAEYLVAQGKAEKRMGADGTVIYTARAQRRGT